VAGLAMGGAADTPLGRLHPLILFGYAVLAGLLPLGIRSLPVLGICLGAVLLLALWDGTPRRVLVRRLIALNGFLALLVLTLPWSFPGGALFSFGSFAYSQDGFLRAIAITLRANAIVAGLTVFFARLDAVAIGHCLEWLRVPRRFARLFQLTVRYLTLFDEEVSRLRRAMAARCFSGGLNRHALKSLGYLVGGVLVRAYDRAHRIENAMACRGFRGRFPSLSASVAVPKTQSAALATAWTAGICVFAWSVFA